MMFAQQTLTLIDACGRRKQILSEMRVRAKELSELDIQIKQMTEDFQDG